MEKHLKFDLLDPDKLVKINELQEITNPIFFIRDGVPTSDGLLSNEIFGISKDDRAGIFGYIDLSDWFIHPYTYKIWVGMDKKIRQIVHGTNKFKIDASGQLVEDENGSTGIKFLKNNMDKIKIKSTDSTKRDDKIDFLDRYKHNMFIRKWIVIPAYYRDVNSDRGYIGVGEVNKLYDSLLIAVRALKETADYGLQMSDATNGRIQEILLQLYNWFTKGTENSGSGLAGKPGIIKRSVMAKTSDYASRLVLSAPELKVERLEDLMVDLDHSAVPLASVCANLFPYIIFWIRRFFENQFSGTSEFPVRNKEGNIRFVKAKDPLIQFSDTRIKKEIERFMYGYSNRFIPVEVETEENKLLSMSFKGRYTDSQDVGKLSEKPNETQPGNTPLLSRRLTWCDLIFMAAVDCSKDKHALITRYPLDNYFGQFPTKIVVSSTKETEPMFVDNIFYKHYPKIREKDIGSNTSNKFVDTMNICNCYLDAIGGDYDGDQVTCKVAYSIEANDELDRFMNSKAHYINLGGKNIRQSSKEAIQSLYNMTLILPGTKLSEPEY